MSAAPAPNSAADPSALATAWPRSAQLTTAFLVGALAALVAVNVLGNWGGAKPAVLQHGAADAYRVDLNHAGRAELLQLPGIGPATADRIAADRRDRGPFRSVDDLTRVPGIGPVARERMRPWVDVGPGQIPAAGLPDGRKSGGKKIEDLKQPIDVNRASAEELQRLPRIGPKMAQRIIEARQKAPFQSIADLRRVSGIGPKTLERLRPYVTVHPANEVAAGNEF
jgi:competence protein ComEA